MAALKADYYQVAANSDNTPEWLSDEKINAFMASIDAPEAVLVG